MGAVEVSSKGDWSEDGWGAFRSVFLGRKRSLYVGVDSVTPKVQEACQNLCFGNQQLTAQISNGYRNYCQVLAQDSGQLRGWMGVFRGKDLESRLESDRVNPRIRCFPWAKVKN
jgi:hypothetical protein